MKKNKLKLYGMKKSKEHNVFEIEKHKIFLERFRECLHNLGFEAYDTAKVLLSLMGDADNNYEKIRYSDTLYADKYFYISNDLYKVEIFFGKEKIIVSVFTKQDKQQEIMKQINKFCKFK